MRSTKPQTPAPVTYDCDAMTHGSTVYFGPLMDVPELYKAHVTGKAHYCVRTAGYEVDGSRACEQHLVKLLRDASGRYVDGIVPLRVLATK